ncbi:uncharacterized protein LOC123880301 isoform X2 [Maniola jurtina]|uniref:uncharacterized protein LOC123880301 isoform X2 n=1 Tax=Maniola jurtina TaxID=191418 RepID=UPI001E686C66|nr:uncharacterized protein LOC123880301 isoform X2 [Maniola jurtina]
MDDGFKINTDKRHRSSSSLAGCLDNVRSEKKLDIRGSIPEVDDQFALAEARCDDLREKIDLVKMLKRKKKLKKRSMTTIAEPTLMCGTTDNYPLISVSTQPKKKLTQQAARLGRIELPQNSNPMRGYLDPDLVEQHHMLNRVNNHKYNAHKSTRQPKMKVNRASPENGTLEPRSHLRRTCADGDTMCGKGVQISMKNMPQEVACGDDELSGHTEEDVFMCANDICARPKLNSRGHVESRDQSKQSSGNRRRHVPKEPFTETASPLRWPEDTQERWRGSRSPLNRQRQSNQQHSHIANNINEVESRPVVELFNKNRPTSASWPRQENNIRETKNHKARCSAACQEDMNNMIPSEDVMTKPRKKVRRVKYQSRRYELPTVSSQMKQAGMRYYYGDTNHTNIPFVVSKSTAPSHNVGVNIQQVLNGLKMQQPLSGIPLTIAHHMGLRHIPTYGARNSTEQPVLHKSEINVIKLGHRMVRLPSFKCMSYNRLLALYREGEGIVPRFLNAVSRPHYFYTSMYDLATKREDFDAATSKGCGGSQEAKQNLAEYANLYREYERIEKSLNDHYDPDLEMRKKELARQLTEREDYIRKVVQEYKPGSDTEPTLRASASTADDAYRHSTFKLNSNDPK